MRIPSTIHTCKFLPLFMVLFFLSPNFSNSVNINHTNIKTNSFFLNEKAVSVFQQLNIADLDFGAFKAAYNGYSILEKEGKLKNKILSVIDFSKSSNTQRMYVIDMELLELKYQTLVSHGKDSGEEYAKIFSNVLNSNKSSIGFYLTGETYSGKHGYSLRLDGIEESNSAARDRAIVMHSANYATSDFIKKNGRLGRSQGCPALPPLISKQVIDLIKEGSCLFIYYPCLKYLSTSDLLKNQN
ncbi:MAG: murein L,D-transpeptidase catalytic domain family protein [Bacteroidetes bacterium]|nr:murein L,D-transpeptidase catalytic domain family protein [Bacteroidota bacterium]HET6244888.1 murein L,D-transpeptidase catalytic domain family protein [Bacteroidia bacterium]